MTKTRNSDLTISQEDVSFSGKINNENTPGNGGRLTLKYKLHSDIVNDGD